MSVPPTPTILNLQFLAATITSLQLANFLNLLLGFLSTFFQSTEPGAILSKTFNKSTPLSLSSYKL